MAQIVKELEQVDAQNEYQVISKHPRYAKLCSEYGAPVINRSKDDRDRDLLKFKFFKRENENDPYTPLFEKKLLKYYTLYDLFFYAARTLEVNPLNLHLYWITQSRQAKLYRTENAADNVKDNTKSLESTPGWASTEVELVRSVKLLDLVFYDGLNSIRVEVDPVIEFDDSAPQLPDHVIPFGDFMEIVEKVDKWRGEKLAEAKKAKK
jgi:hypothetical protein